MKLIIALLIVRLSMSLPSRGAWIEITESAGEENDEEGVAPLAGSVD